MKKKASLLIIDDDENMLETLSDILQEKGYQTETAKTGHEAIIKAEGKFFNISLIDIKLPDMSGIEVLRTFRRKYPSRMNIVITAHATLHNTMDALNVGANTYLMKPIDLEKLDKTIKKCLQKQHSFLFSRTKPLLVLLTLLLAALFLAKYFLAAFLPPLVQKELLFSWEFLLSVSALLLVLLWVL